MEGLPDRLHAGVDLVGVLTIKTLDFIILDRHHLKAWPLRIELGREQASPALVGTVLCSLVCDAVKDLGDEIIVLMLDV